MTYFSSVLPSKCSNKPKVFKTIEVLPIQSNFGGEDVIVMGNSRSLKVNGKNYYETLEKELHEICSWKTFKPFTDFKNKQGNSVHICLKVNDVLERDQTKVGNHFANIFTTMADGIGGDYVIDKS